MVARAPCKCVVESGGGDVLPTEVGHLTRQEKKDNASGLSGKGIKIWTSRPRRNFWHRAGRGIKPNVSTFIKEFVLPPVNAATFLLPAGGLYSDWCRLLWPISKPMDITPHPDLGHKPDVFKVIGTSLSQDLKMKNELKAFSAPTLMANHPAEGEHCYAEHCVATLPWDRANNKWMDVNPRDFHHIFRASPADKVPGSFAGNLSTQHSAKMIYIGGCWYGPLRAQIFHLLPH